jgi:hypothetical protein
LEVLIVTAIAAEYVSVDADPMNGVFAAIVNPDMVILESRLEVVTSATLSATVGVDSKFNFA